MGLPTLHASRRHTDLAVGAAQAWSVVASGSQGRHWYVDAAPLVFRGRLDRLLGGAGADRLPPGRALLRAGDRVGFWEVREAGAGPDGTAGHRLVLRARVRAPGEVLLTTEVTPLPAGCRVGQAVSFAPEGLAGRAYLLADLPAREVLLELVHRRLLAEVRRDTPGGAVA